MPRKVEICWCEVTNYRAVLELPDEAPEDPVKLHDWLTEDYDVWFDLVDKQHPEWFKTCLTRVDERDLIHLVELKESPV